MTEIHMDLGNIVTKQNIFFDILLILFHFFFLESRWKKNTSKGGTWNINVFFFEKILRPGSNSWRSFFKPFFSFI